jgi:hypothetical protein
MLIFALSITPKRFLHEVFAKHSDSRTKKNTDKPFQVNYQGFNCEVDNLVAQSPFESYQNSFAFPSSSSFIPYIFSNVSFFSTEHVHSSLRGPPAII